MSQVVEWKQDAKFLGRNGYFKCRGVDVWVDAEDGIVTLTPITSRGERGRCFLEIPVAKLGELAGALAALSKPKPKGGA